MGFFKTLAQIDHKIMRLKQARALLERSPFLWPSSKYSRKRGLASEGRSRPHIQVDRGWVTGNKPATHLACQPPQL